LVAQKGIVEVQNQEVAKLPKSVFFQRSCVSVTVIFAQNSSKLLGSMCTRLIYCTGIFLVMAYKGKGFVSFVAMRSG